MDPSRDQEAFTWAARLQEAVGARFLGRGSNRTISTSRLQQRSPHVHQRKAQQVAASPLCRIKRLLITVPQANAPDPIVGARFHDNAAGAGQKEVPQWLMLPELFDVTPRDMF